GARGGRPRPPRRRAGQAPGHPRDRHRDRVRLRRRAGRLRRRARRRGPRPRRPVPRAGWPPPPSRRRRAPRAGPVRGGPV
ncbi:MAG: Predicted transcriptional regulators, partial [uncultured Actinomycetospora sp.]